MRIVCPQCGYSRDIPDDKIPARSSMASCPKCSFRFRFRGHMPQPEPSVSFGEPVYPPRPSRPEREPEVSSENQFEARSQRLYVGDDPQPYSQTPRPQARWLPDPEPEQQQDSSLRPEPRADLRANYRPAFQEDEMPAAARRTRRPAFEPEEPGQDAYAVENAAPALQPRPQATWEPDPATMTETRTVEPAQPLAPVREPEPEPALPDDHEWSLPPSPPKAPEPAQPAASAATDAPDAVQPAASEAVAGQDSVRDIWARLQAMSAAPSAASPQGQRQQTDAPAAAAAHFSADSTAPWETLEHYGVVPAFMLTVKNILTAPGDFFDQLPPVTGKVRPLVFAVAVCMVTVLFGLVWNFFGMGPNLSELGRTEWFQGLGAGALGKLAWLGLAPILVTAFVFLDSALAHLLLGLLRSATKTYDETFRTVCYAGGPWLLAALPVPYSYLIPVVLIWHMTLQAIGLKKLHQAGYPQVLAAVLVKWSLYFMASFAVLHLLLTRR